MKIISRLNAALLLSLIASGAASLKAAPVSGDIYVSEAPLLAKISADGTQTIIPSTVLTPSGLAFDQSGNVFIGDSLTQSVIKIGPDGTQTTVATGLSDPQDLAVDASGNLFIANSGANSVVKVAPDGTQTTIATGLNNPAGLALDPTGNLFVSSTGANAIFKITPDGTKTTFVSAGLDAPGGIAFDALGNLLVADTGSDAILSVDRDGNVTTAIDTGLDAPTDVAVDGAGNLIVSDSGSKTLLRISPEKTITSLGSTLNAPKFLAMTPGLHQLLDVSTRGFVGTGDQILIGGFIVQGTPDADLGQTNVLIRAIGPSLVNSHVAGPLANPTLELHDSSGALVASNDNWKDTQKTQVQATGLAPKNNLESAILAALPDGTYTAIVSGANGLTGIALVEVYKLQ